MIAVRRGPEPAALASERSKRLPILRALGRPPSSDEIEGYRVVSGDLRRHQHLKCCYCEKKVEESYNDVEHYRPKGRANRLPGSAETHGYWWLAHCWENLLFACPQCNRSGKNDQFPLRAGGTALRPEQQPPGGEHALFIDPAGRLNPAEHIQFVPAHLEPGGEYPVWMARPRAGSLYGSHSIDVCKLNRDGLSELRGDHVKDNVVPVANELKQALQADDQRDIRRALQRAQHLMSASSVYTLLSYDALRWLVPPTELRRRGRCWPDPGLLPLP